MFNNFNIEDPNNEDVYYDNPKLNFLTYEDYLDSCISFKDYKYLGSEIVCRDVALLGHSRFNNILTRKQFYDRSMADKDPSKFYTKDDMELKSKGLEIEDPFLYALALREQSIRMKLLTTIIFIHIRTEQGHDISSFIDYEHSLKNDMDVDWRKIFEGKAKLFPRPTDMLYYHWNRKYIAANATESLTVRNAQHFDCYFYHNVDKICLRVGPMINSKRPNIVRSDFDSKMYPHAVLYDHLILHRI